MHDARMSFVATGRCLRLSVIPFGTNACVAASVFASTLAFQRGVTRRSFVVRRTQRPARVFRVDAGKETRPGEGELSKRRESDVFFAGAKWACSRTTSALHGSGRSEGACKIPCHAIHRHHCPNSLVG